MSVAVLLMVCRDGGLDMPCGQTSSAVLLLWFSGLCSFGTSQWSSISLSLLWVTVSLLTPLFSLGRVHICLFKSLYPFCPVTSFRIVDCWWRLSYFQKDLLFFFFKVFWYGPFLKSLLNLLQYCFCFMFCFFGPKACGILAAHPGIELSPRAWEGEVLTTRWPGKSPVYFF